MLVQMKLCCGFGLAVAADKAVHDGSAATLQAATLKMLAEHV
jgi:hypothetical protein